MGHRRRHIEEQILNARESFEELVAATVPRDAAVSMLREHFRRVLMRMRKVVLGVPAKGSVIEYAEAMRAAVRAALDRIADEAAPRNA